MNKPIVRVYAFLLLLLALLVWKTSQWAVFDAQSLLWLSPAHSPIPVRDSSPALSGPLSK